MSESKKERGSEEAIQKAFGAGISRKNFLKYAGASAVAASTFGLVSCNDDEVPGGDNTVNLGSGDVGVLNYAYALEQLEAAFYVNVMSNPYSGMTDEEAQILGDLRDHEVTHRDWFAAVLNQIAPKEIIPGLTPVFDSIDFSSRASVLGTAAVLEDTGVGAYNGAGPLISQTDAGKAYLVEAGKIVSVEARHAAAIRDLINGGASFAGDDVVDPDTGLDLSYDVTFVLSADAAGGFVKEQLDGSNVGQ